MCFLSFHPEPRAGGGQLRALRGETGLPFAPGHLIASDWPVRSVPRALATWMSRTPERPNPLLGWLWPGQESQRRGLPGLGQPGPRASADQAGGQCGHRPGLAEAGPPPTTQLRPICCCRCNTQDYIWHKGTRCESIVTDFQVMCVAVGAAALVLLLLFMVTVFFAKKLYLLKTENTKLRRTQ